MNKFTYLISILCLTGCFSKNEHKAIQAIQQIVHAQNISLGSGFSTESGNENINYKSVTIKGGEYLNNPGIDASHLTSLSALTLYRHLSKEELKKKNAIKIILERSLGGSTTNIETLYSIDNIRLADSLINSCEAFCKELVTANYNNSYQYISKELKQELTLPMFIEMLNDIDKKFGKTNSYLINGFEIKKVSSEEGPITALNFSVTLFRDSINNELDLFYGTTNKSKGIMGINL